jgi:hypothetical protein
MGAGTQRKPASLRESCFLFFILRFQTSLKLSLKNKKPFSKAEGFSLVAGVCMTSKRFVTDFLGIKKHLFGY